MWRAEHIDMTWEDEYDAEVAAEEAAVAKALPDVIQPSQSPAGSPPSLEDPSVSCSHHHASQQSNWTSISSTPALMPPRHGVAACRPDSTLWPALGDGGGHRSWARCGGSPRAWLVGTPALGEPHGSLRGSGIIAWALGATLVPQLAACRQESALCCRGDCVASLCRAPDHLAFALLCRATLHARSSPLPAIHQHPRSATAGQQPLPRQLSFSYGGRRRGWMGRMGGWWMRMARCEIRTHQRTLG